MRVRLMQIIDFWVGVPLCFLMTCWDSLKGLLSPSVVSRTIPSKILFIELSEMGSAILAYSTLIQAQKKFPGCSLYFLIFKKNAESCEILNVIPKEQIITIDDRSFLKFTFSTLKALAYIRKLGIDTTIDMELFSRCTALITYLSGARNRVGFHRGTNEGLYRGRLITHAVPYNPHQHIALSFLALLASLQEPHHQVPLVKKNLKSELIDLPKLGFSEEETNEAKNTLSQAGLNLSADSELILFNPDPGDALPIRGWPLDRFIEVAGELLRDPKASIAVIGLKGSKRYADAMITSLGSDRCFDLTGKTPTLRAVTAIMNLSKLLVTNDSGPAHLASLTGTPTVVLFGPETPTLYGPLNKRAISLFSDFACSPCLSALNHRYTKCNDNLCLKAIPTAEVLRSAEILLRGHDAHSGNKGLRVISG